MTWYLTPEQESALAPVLYSRARRPGRFSLRVWLCRHARRQWPVKGVQCCPDCFGTRAYNIHGAPGRWGRG